MLKFNLIATGSLLFGLLGLTVYAQLDNKKEDKVNVLILDKTVPSATVSGAVLQVEATKTVYYVYCSAFSGPNIGDGWIDPCPIMGGSVTQLPTRWEYDVGKTTLGVTASLDAYTSHYSEETTGKIICDVTSNRATCTGALTINATTNVNATGQAGITRTGSTTIDTTITDVSKSIEPVVITSGYSRIESAMSTTTTRRTSSSTGAAAAFVTQPAGGLRLGVVGAAAVVGGALVL